MNMTTRMGTLLAALFLAAATAMAGESGTILKADDLMAGPFRDAKTIGTLKAGESVEILKKQGGWFQIKTTGGSGWVRMLTVRRGEARKATVDTAGLLGLASGRAGTGRVVATTGIRGLSEENLKAARYNDGELKKADSFVATPDQARQFAAEGKLAARKVPYLPTPQP